MITSRENRSAKALPHFAGVAQLVERQPSKLNVVGSIPITRSTGEVAEWTKALVLKTSVGQPTVGSNPTLSAITEVLG